MKDIKDEGLESKHVFGAAVFCCLLTILIMAVGYLTIGAIAGDFLQKVTERVTTVVATTTVSVLTEKQECEKKGGEFQITGNYQRSGYELLCIKFTPSQKLFDITVE